MDISIKISEVNLQSGLYIVATPIGNLKDITLRALEVLSSVDIIICEDTRVSNKLLSHYGIRKKLYVYNDNDGVKSRDKILDNLEGGQSVALISDAGTPLISDPGFKLIREALKRDIYVTSIPGASSTITALTLSGLPSNRFVFEGFLAPKVVARQKQFEHLANIDATMIFFERSSRVKDSLEEMLAVFGNREAVIAREISKRYEEILSGNISELIEIVKVKDNLKGEVVLLISPPNGQTIDDKKLEKTIADLLQDMKLKNVVKHVVEETGISKNYIYSMALKIRDGK